MQVDWTTFVLEIVNFLVLLWILKRFLYQPVLKVLGERRAAIEKTLSQANDTQAHAASLEKLFQNRLADWEQEKSRQRTQFETELAAERARQMQVLEKDLDVERERRLAQDERKLEQAQQQIETQAHEQAGRFAATLMSRLAGPELEARLIDAFIEDWTRWPDARLDGLRAASSADHANAQVVSAYPLAPEQRERIASTLAARIGDVPVTFIEDHALVAGLRVSIGAWQIQMTIADELAQFAASASRVE
jgi:F-type H+-transporting ATPase subunit b